MRSGLAAAGAALFRRDNLDPVLLFHPVLEGLALFEAQRLVAVPKDIHPVGHGAVLRSFELQGEALAGKQDFEPGDAIEIIDRPAQRLFDLGEGRAERQAVIVLEENVGGAGQRAALDKHLDEAEVVLLGVAHQAQKAGDLRRIRLLGDVFVLARLPIERRGDAIGDVVGRRVPVRRDIQPSRLVPEIENDLIRGEAVDDPFVSQDETLMMRAPDEDDLRAGKLDDLLQLAAVTIVLLGSRSASAATRSSPLFRNSLNFAFWPPRRLWQAHAREANLVQPVEEKDLLQLGPGTLVEWRTPERSCRSRRQRGRERDHRLTQTSLGDSSVACIDLREANDAAGTNLTSSSQWSFRWALRSRSGTSTGRPRR